MIGRREFLRNTLATTGAALAARSLSSFAWAQSSGVDSRIEVLSGEPLGVDVQPRRCSRECESSFR
jgi:hypothetical protein